jgi:serine/threonine-protein kinase
VKLRGELDETASALAVGDPIAPADPDATISPAALEVARTFAALSPSAAPSFEAVELPRLVVASDERTALGSPSPDLVVARELGRGGMGCVHLARQTVFGRTVAVKRVRPDRLCDAAVRALLDEARLASALDHPNIVPVHLLGQSEAGEPVLVMKRVEGTVWRALAAEAPGDSAPADRLGRHLEILRQVCNAVEFAHRHGVVHRDIKLENVMVGDLGEVYLLDWGVALRLGAPPPTELAGTPSHMAPEMVPGVGPVTARTDVYLLGATLHELITGRTRHEGDTIWAVLGSAARSEPFAYDASVPEELAAIANRATAREPSERFPSALAFGEALDEFQRHRGSLDLSAEADRLLVELRATLALVATDGAAETRAGARRTSMECAYGYRQALRAWPENPHAEAGLRACVEATAAFELAERNAPGAELLLAGLRPPNAALAAELERLKLALAEEALAPAELARIVRDHDVFLEGETGGASPAVFSAILGLSCIAGSRFGLRLSGPSYVAWSAVMFAAAAATLHAQRSKLVFNRASARRVLGTATVFPFQLVAALVGWAQHTPVVHAVQVTILGQALMATLVGVTVTPLLLIGVPLYLGALGALVAWPQDALVALGVLGLLQAAANRLEAAVVHARARSDSPPTRGGSPPPSHSHEES